MHAPRRHCPATLQVGLRIMSIAIAFREQIFPAFAATNPIFGKSKETLRATISLPAIARRSVSPD